MFSEDFEGPWPGPWILRDTVAASGYDYWGKVYRADGWVHQGDSSAWCAAVGDKPDGGSYDDNMEAQMITRNGIDLSASSNDSLFYWLMYSTEYADDWMLDWWSRDGVNWELGDAYTGSSYGWTRRSYALSDDIDTYYQKFVFSSNEINSYGYAGAYLDEILVEGELSPQPNLTFGTPPGWYGPIVPSSITGTHTVNTLYTNQSTFLDFAVRNIGTATNETFFTDLYVDQNWVNWYYTFGLNASAWDYFEDELYTVVSPGSTRRKS